MTLSAAELSRVIAEEIAVAVGSVADASITTALTAIERAPRIFVFGEGRSGLALRMGAMRLVHLGKTVHIVGDATTPAIGPGDLLIAASGSGGTAVTVLIAEQARRAGATVLAITANQHGRLAECAEMMLLINTPAKGSTEVGSSRQPGGTLFEQSMLVLLDTLFLLLAGESAGDQITQHHANLE